MSSIHRRTGHHEDELGSTIYSRMSRAGAQRVVTTLFRIMGRRDGAGVRLITRYGDDFTSRFPHRVWPNRTSNNSWALPKKHTAGQRFRLFCLLREIRGVLCFAPIGRPTCMTKRSSRSFCSALKSIRQSNNANERCIRKRPGRLPPGSSAIRK